MLIGDDVYVDNDQMSSKVLRCKIKNLNSTSASVKTAFLRSRRCQSRSPYRETRS